MAYSPIATEDFVISSEAVVSSLWSNGNTTLTNFYTSSNQEGSSAGNFYLNVYQTSSDLSIAEVQFAVAYGNKYGYGSAPYNSAVTASSPTKTTYGQYRTLVNGDENTDFTFGRVGTNNQFTSTEFWVVNIDRSRYKESLLPGGWSLILGTGSKYLSLTDDSLQNSTIVFKDAGRIYQIVSGSSGTVYTGANSYGYATSGSYGWFLPDIGVLLFNPTAISQSLQLFPNPVTSSAALNNRKFFAAIASGSFFSARSQETISADYIFIRARNAEFNYTENPSFTNAVTGEVNYPVFINNPQTYITTIGFYNDMGDLLAVAKMSRPLPKDFTKEALVRVKLDF